jgi:hypothetical protein
LRIKEELERLMDFGNSRLGIRHAKRRAKDEDIDSSATQLLIKEELEKLMDFGNSPLYIRHANRCTKGGDTDPSLALPTRRIDFGQAISLCPFDESDSTPCPSEESNSTSTVPMRPRTPAIVTR